MKHYEVGRFATELYKPSELEKLPTIHQGQCCDCKIDNGGVRVWLCRVAGGVTIENCINGRWITVAGSCDDVGGESADCGYQPKTGVRCHCRPGVSRDNCPDCEGTGWRIDFAAIRNRKGGAR